MKSRLEILQEMVARDSQNAFARYGLAQELANQERLEEALAEYERLIEIKPDYCYAYFHGGRTLERLGQVEEARRLYRRGIEASSQAGDLHARSELEAALAELGGQARGPAPTE